MTAAPTLSAVIVNHRRYDLVADCLRSLRESSRPPDRIVVVDNESVPEEAAAIAAEAPDAVVLANPDNRGYATACNQGWRSAPADVTVFLNADVTVTPACLELCMDALRADPDIGIVTARLVRSDGRPDHACHRGTPTLSASVWYALRLHRLMPRSRRFAHYTMSWLDPTTDHDIEACSGAFLMIRSDVLQRIGGWDERYWFYAEDIDLCLRARKAGLRVRYLAKAVAIHLKGASSHLRDPDHDLSAVQLAHRRRIRRAIVDSHQLFYREHLAQTTPRAVRPLVGLAFTMQRSRAGR